MNKMTRFSVSLLTAMFILLAACSTQSSVSGLWKDINDDGTIEFKENGEVIVIDNMSATVTGTYLVKDNSLITIEFTASDILRDSIQPIEKTIVTAKIIKLTGDELQLSFSEAAEVESFKRVQ